MHEWSYIIIKSLALNTIHVRILPKIKENNLNCAYTYDWGKNVNLSG